MKKLYALPMLIFGICFLIGLVIFFPIGKLRYVISDAASNMGGLNLQIGRLSMGTGLTMGLLRGGLIGLHGENVTIATNTGASLRCSRLSLSPHLLTLFVGRLELAFSCEIPEGEKSDAMEVSGLVKASPFWKPSNTDLKAELSDVKLDILGSFFPAAASASGALNGEVTVSDLKPNARTLPKIEWNLKGKDIVLPPVSSDFLNLPSLELGPVQTQGKFTSGKLKLDDLKFGTDNAPLSGNFHADFGLDSTGQPVSGELTGKLKTDPTFEATQLKDIKLDLLFGKVDPSGSREFKKVVNGSVISLLMSPPVE
jgi:type II secretion system protein N